MTEITASDGTRLFHLEEGEGPVVLLVHGFGSNHRTNWIVPGWTKALVGNGFRILTYDQRGHGRSDAPHDPAAYQATRLSDDAAAVLDAVGVERAIVMGYSMGAGVSLHLAVRHPSRVRALVLGGMGSAFPMLDAISPEPAPALDTEIVARALEDDDPGDLPAAIRAYRSFGERNGGDLRALAACWRRPRHTFTRAEIEGVQVPALVVVGDRDGVAGDGQPLADALPLGRCVTLPGKDHMRAVGDLNHRRVVLEFLASLPPLR